jgi:hypothetical protein
MIVLFKRPADGRGLFGMNTPTGSPELPSTRASRVFQSGSRLIHAPDVWASLRREAVTVESGAAAG